MWLHQVAGAGGQLRGLALNEKVTRTPDARMQALSCLGPRHHLLEL